MLLITPLLVFLLLEACILSVTTPTTDLRSDAIVGKKAPVVYTSFIKKGGRIFVLRRVFAKAGLNRIIMDSRVSV